MSVAEQPPIPVAEPAAAEPAAAAGDDVINFALSLLVVTKTLHWAAATTGQHLAFDKAFDSLNGHLDRLVEVYMAAYGKQPMTSYAFSLKVSLDANEDKRKHHNALYDQALSLAHALKRRFETTGHDELSNQMQEVMSDIYQCKFLTNLD